MFNSCDKRMSLLSSGLWLISQAMQTISIRTIEMYRNHLSFFFCTNKASYYEILSTTFIHCSHGEIRFLQSKNNSIDSRTRTRNQFQKCRNRIALAVSVWIQKMPPEDCLCQPWLWNAIGSCVSPERLRHATGREYAFEWDVSALTERDHFQWLKPYVLCTYICLYINVSVFYIVQNRVGLG